MFPETPKKTIWAVLWGKILKELEDLPFSDLLAILKRAAFFAALFFLSLIGENLGEAIVLIATAFNGLFTRLAFAAIVAAFFPKVYSLFQKIKADLPAWKAKDLPDGSIGSIDRAAIFSYIKNTGAVKITQFLRENPEAKKADFLGLVQSLGRAGFITKGDNNSNLIASHVTDQMLVDFLESGDSPEKLNAIAFNTPPSFTVRQIE